jgi:ParB family chromosome partitioning protein
LISSKPPVATRTAIATSPMSRPEADAAPSAVPGTSPDAAPGFARELSTLRVDQIDPNPDQPRRHFDAARLEELASSIARSGVLQPVVVVRSGERYTLIVGERRWRASLAAGLETIPAVVADVDPKERLELAIVENVQRQDLNPIELANAYRALADRGATQDEIGKSVGKNRSSVANLLRLLELPVDIQGDIEAGRISMGHAKALLQLSDPDECRQLRDRVVSEGLSVREAEQSGRETAGPSASGGARRPRAVPDDAGAGELAELLERHFQTRVRILGTQERGRIEISYASGEDLDRLSRLILEGL